MGKKQQPLNRFDDYKSERYRKPLPFSIESDDKAESNWALAIEREKEITRRRIQAINFLFKNRGKEVLITTRKEENVGRISNVDGGKIVVRVMRVGSIDRLTSHSIEELVFTQEHPK